MRRAWRTTHASPPHPQGRPPLLGSPPGCVLLSRARSPRACPPDWGQAPPPHGCGGGLAGFGSRGSLPARLCGHHRDGRPAQGGDRVKNRVVAPFRATTQRQSGMQNPAKNPLRRRADRVDRGTPGAGGGSMDPNAEGGPANCRFARGSRRYSSQIDHFFRPILIKKRLQNGNSHYVLTTSVSAL